MNRKETGEFLYRYYHKRTSSFLVNIYKASITGDSKDIHRARLDVKKLFALYGLFELIDPDAFRQQPGYTLFRPLFRQAGKIREAQVSSALMAQFRSAGAECRCFASWLREGELQAVQKFLLSVQKFREKELKKTERVVRKICYSRSKLNLISKTGAFVISRIRIVKELQSGVIGDKEIHRIRQHLKNLSTITSLVYSLKPARRLDTLNTALNKTEMMIGEWHDRVVLKESIEKFIGTATFDLNEELDPLNRLIRDLNDYKENLVMQFMPVVNAIVSSVIQENE